MNLQSQRDQFVAFAFASADLLIQADGDGVIRHAWGAAAPLGAAGANTLAGTRAAELFTPADRPRVEALLKRAKAGRRAGPILATPEGRAAPVAVNAGSLPGDADRFVTISYAVAHAPAAGGARDADTGMLAADGYVDAAQAALEELQEHGREARVTMLSLEGQRELIERLPEGGDRAFFDSVSAILRNASAGDAASRVGEDRYSVLHDAALDPSSLRDDLAEAARAIDPTGEGVAVDANSLTLDPAMSAQDNARALAYAVSTFAEEGAQLGEEEEVSGALAALVRDASSRIVEFKRAIADRRFRFVAQPVVDLNTRRISHYEMLVRFEANRSPFEVVSFAERMGVIADLDMAAVELAASFLERQAGADFPGLAVNVSGLSIVNPAFAASLFDRTARFAFPREKFHFEITESSEITDLDAADRTIAKLRRLGHHVCLDDFGAGSASFPYLRALNIDGVKIDGAYVREALANRRDAMLLKAMVGLCRDLNVVTIAEMIEREDQLQHLKKLGVNKGQGWLFGKPVSLMKLRKSEAA